MPKPTKKRIDEVAAKLRLLYHFRIPDPTPWREAHPSVQASWRHVAKYVLTELLPADDACMMYGVRYSRKRRPAKQPKACRIDGGKVVCK